MIKRVKQWLLALLIAVLSVVGISQTVQAARVEVDPSNPIVASNDLFIPKNPSMGNPNDATIEVSGTSDYTLEGENSTTPSEAAFQQEYGSFKLKLNNRNDWSKLKVVVDHGTVATYDGQPVHVKLEYSNFVKSDKEPSDFYNRGNYLNLSKNIFSGFIFSGTSTFDVRLVVLDSNGQAILLDNAYMGFGSLNPSGSGSSDGAWSEGVGFNKINTNDYYVTNDTLLEEVVNPATGSGQLLLGQRVGSADTDDWNANYDKLGAINYNRATVSFKLSGTDNVFTIYSGRANNDAYTWNSMTTSTLFSVEPEKPVKDVMNDAGASINGDLVQAGQTLTYEISQKVSVLGQDLLERYSKFMIEDQLDKNVTYFSSKLVDATGKTVDADGKYVYDESGHKLTYTASDKFLTEMPLEGETYRLLVTVKVNDSVADGVEINNKAMVTINNVSNSTNEVKNKVEIPKAPVKSIQDASGSDLNGKLILSGTSFNYKVTQQVTNGNQFTSWKITDKLDANVTYNSSRLLDESGKAVDEGGSYAYDEKSHTVTYKASKEFLSSMKMAGQSYQLEINVTAKKDIASGTVIENTATSTINDKDQVTNKVTVTVENPKAPVKSIQDASGTDLNGKLILSGTSFNYKVTQQVTNGNQFTSWKITDKLDANVTYNSSRLLDESGKAVDEGGSYAYDEKSHTVTYTASKEFLSSMKMAGQSYQLEINVTAKKDIASGTVIENTATSTINDKDQITNKVTVTVENPKAPVKSIQDVAGTDLNGKLILSGTPFSYKLTQQVTNGNQFTSWKITDKLDANVTYNSSRLLDESGKAVDEGGSYTYDEKSHTVTYTSSKEFLSNMKMAGQSYQLEINVTAKKDIASGTVIKNTATSTINDKDQLTNEVTVTVPSLEAKIYKTTWQPISTVTKEEETADSSSSGVLANLLFNVAYAADSDEADTKTINGLTYTLQKQAGVTYELQAVEEILYGDGTVAYAAGEVADTQTTDASGYATFTVKMPGEYEFIEISAPKGIQVDPTPIPVTIEAVGETNISDAKQTDLNQNVVLEGTKTFEQEDGSFVAEDGATFALFNAEDISVDENVEVTADTKLADIELAEDGSFSHVTELISGEIYYISEQSTTENHVLKMNKMYFKYEATNSDENYVFHFYETGYTVEDVFIPYADVEALLSEEVAQEDETTNSTSTTESSNEGSSSSSEENQTTESSEVTTETTSSSEVTEEETVLADNLVSSHDAATDEQLLDIQNILITENSISKAIQKEDGSLVDNYDGLQDQETVIFVGTVNIGNNNAAGTPISFSDTLPEGLSYNSYTVSDSEGNDVTDQTTITVDDRAISVSVNQDYADTLSQTYLKWTIDTTYTHDTRLEGTTLENTMQLTVGDETTESNVVTLTPLIVQGGKLPQTGEIVTGLSLVGVLLLLNVLYFKKRQLADEEE
ncbi:isopeptide-forming domain-containing fimbrial protein [Enterococcus sp. HY326]|uniref:isopeptide-forming domain-containing fimbrial protein n=1 Tax=Enterococcus sp. HY326 TaxID=2971265 RepID=UPI00223EC800|nr:isopeptide-forming domain-containing fimbrial protein [Enterococcus sp. HY326]